MAWSFIAAGAECYEGGGTTTITLPTGYAAGDILIIVVSQWNPATPSGWTALNTSGNLGLFYKRAAESESSVVLTSCPSSSRAVMVCYRGIAGLDVQAAVTTYNDPVNTITTHSQTTTTNGDLVVSAYNYNNYSPFNFVSGYPTGTTTRVDTGSSTAGGILLVDETQTTAGATTARTATLGNYSGAGGAAFSFSPAVTNNFFLLM